MWDEQSRCTVDSSDGDHVVFYPVVAGLRRLKYTNSRVSFVKDSSFKDFSMQCPLSYSNKSIPISINIFNFSGACTREMRAHARKRGASCQLCSTSPSTVLSTTAFVAFRKFFFSKRLSGTWRKPLKGLISRCYQDETLKKYIYVYILYTVATQPLEKAVSTLVK